MKREEKQLLTYPPLRTYAESLGIVFLLSWKEAVQGVLVITCRPFGARDLYLTGMFEIDVSMIDDDHGVDDVLIPLMQPTP